LSTFVLYDQQVATPLTLPNNRATSV